MTSRKRALSSKCKTEGEPNIKIEKKAEVEIDAIETKNNVKLEKRLRIKYEIESDSDENEENPSIKKEIESDPEFEVEEKPSIKKNTKRIKKEKVETKLKSNVKRQYNKKSKQQHLEIKIEVNEDELRKQPTQTNVNQSDVNPSNPVQKKKQIQESNHHATGSDGSNWQNYELLSEYLNLDLDISRRIVQLLEEGCTLPFIARYRKDATNNMTPEVLRDVKHNYDKVITLRSRAQTVLNCMGKSGHLDNNLKRSILNARTVEEVEHIYAPFKPGGKRTLAERARALGLQQPAEGILENNNYIDIAKYIDASNSELDTVEKVEKGIIHIVAHIISTDIKVLTFLRKSKIEANFSMEVKKLTKRQTTKAKTTTTKTPDESKYENYFDFKMPVRYMKPHQVLAINRGESQKVLSVKIVVPEFIQRKFTYFCNEKFQYFNCSKQRKYLLDEAMKDCYTRLMHPLLVREIRSELKNSAEKASYEVFCNNLKQLLLTPQIKGRPILGIDPGYSNGCKVALISATGALLSSNVLHLHSNKFNHEERSLKEMLQLHNCSLIALGNGTACRETETWLSNLISKKYFSPLDISYIIINEQGVSIYSCSSEAKKEFPNLDPNIISAVSLARRVQEPLAEYVKVEPKHLGVGMYQHDLPKKMLEDALDEVVSECVSFVGVDLNVASQCLLRRIAGLSDKRATKIIEYRDNKGPFLNRKEIMKISGIGAKIFEQCAGFLRVGPITVDEEVTFYKNKNTNKLDCTIIHPESYELTGKLIKHFNLKLEDIGTAAFIGALKILSINFKVLSESLGASEETLKLIVDALTKPLNYDLRNDCSKVPLFKKGITNLSDIRVGTILTGRISNVTHFGCFTDIGVGRDGLIHVSQMKGQSLQMGNVVEVNVLNIEIERKRIGLGLIRII